MTVSVWNGQRMICVEPEVASQAAGRPAERCARGVAGHAHVLAVDQPPAVQHRLLHGGDEKLAVGADGGAEMRALPFEPLRLGLRRVWEPQCRAIVMGQREPKSFRQEGEAADRRGRFEFAQLLAMDVGRFAGRPCDRAVRPQRDMIDPATLGVCRQRAAFAFGIGGDYFAVIATADDAVAVSRRREDRAAMHGDALRLAFRLYQQQRFLAEH